MITIENVRQKAENDAKRNGYYLNPDPTYLKNLLEGLKKNEERYGYPSCPCRLASGNLDVDRDIICPCDYRDPDVEEFGNCYCTLFVSKDVFERKAAIQPIPERRPREKQERAYSPSKETSSEKLVTDKLSIKRRVWYCKQCGYVCFREEPPYVCPICKAKKEMFNEIKIQTNIFSNNR